MGCAMKIGSKRLNKIKGEMGEERAVKFLKKQKYKILERNYTTHIGEIDIIAEKRDVIVFVEVKERETLEFGRPAEAVDEKKQNKIRQVASLYLQTKRMSFADVRFDVVEILGDEINLIENAF
jgi:putative endonuclease